MTSTLTGFDPLFVQMLVENLPLVIVTAAAALVMAAACVFLVAVSVGPDLSPRLARLFEEQEEPTDLVADDSESESAPTQTADA